MLIRLLVWLTGWRKHSAAQYKGVSVAGDKGVAPTTKLNVLWMLFRGWRNMAVLQVKGSVAAKGYRIGYRLADGTGKIRTGLLYDLRVQVRIGHEDVCFYALDERGREMLLTVVDRVPRGALGYVNVPCI